jgi:hypothetical protein
MAGRDSLVFVYNADSGFFSGLADLAHKTFSPGTYACNLCKLTYSPMGMRRTWKQFLDSLSFELEFLHKDDMSTEVGMADLQLPAVLVRHGGILSLLVDAATLDQCETLDALQERIRAAVADNTGWE